MKINIELDTYKELTSMMYPGAETYDEVIQDLVRRLKSKSRSSTDGLQAVPRSAFEYWYDGIWYSCDSGKDLLASILRRLSSDDPDFLEKYAEEVNAEGRSREYVSRSKEKLYPDNKRLQRNAVEALPADWFLGTNMSNTRKARMIKSACKVLSIRYGIDLVVRMS